MTKLIEFKNHKKETLRGLLDGAKSKRGVIFLHGFEHTTIEPKFKNIVDKIKNKVSCFRFDFSGCGLSDGDFSDISVAKLTQELRCALDVFVKSAPQVKEIVIVTHSLAGCVAVNYLQKKDLRIKKAVLFGPPFNHANLLKYYFVRGAFKGKKDIQWNNWEKNFNPTLYSLWFKTKNKTRKAHYLKNDYFIENREMDYQSLLETLTIPLQNVLIIQGDRDDKVPPASNDHLPKQLKSLMVAGADHTFEHPEVVKKYLSKVISFISQ